MILSDERDIATENICENCRNLRLGRQVQAVGYNRESRGYYFICFDCFAPRVQWQANGRHAKTYWSPVATAERTNGKEIHS